MRPDFPDVNRPICDAKYGDDLHPAKCLTAIEKMPTGNDMRYFGIPSTNGAASSRTDVEYVPLTYYDTADESQASCKVTVDMAAGAVGMVFPATSNDIVNFAMDVYHDCVLSIAGQGGFITMGLENVIDAISDGDLILQPSPPEDYHYPSNLPPFLTVKISHPSEMTKSGDTDIAVSALVQEGLWDRYEVLDSIEAYEGRVIMESINILDQIQLDRINGDHDGNWYDNWNHQTPDVLPTNVAYKCSETLGTPSTPNCETAGYELQGSGQVLLDPASGPIVQVIGNCAIAISVTRKRYTNWDVIKAAASMLLTQCVANPFASHVGGVATAQSRSDAGTAVKGTRPAMLALGIQIAVYLQGAYTGLATDTCEFQVVRNRTGDVRQCGH